MLALITGGSGSGKSAFAEDLMLSLGGGRRVYIATMFPFDEESRKRIERHRILRKDKSFETLECYTGLAELELDIDDLVLLECMSNLTANEMYQELGAGNDTVREILNGIEETQKQVKHFCIVTNEIFSDGIDYDKETKRYQSNLGELNQKLAKMADLVVEVVCGIPLYLKGEYRFETTMEQL